MHRGNQGHSLACFAGWHALVTCCVLVRQNGSCSRAATTAEARETSRSRQEVENSQLVGPGGRSE
jgi:hypothetical protein